MLLVERVSVMNMENAIRGARNPLNSWARMDSYYDERGNFVLGENDLSLARRLAKAGSDHRKYLRQIMVSMDITAPLYWWKEFDTYKVGTVANSCSTMHCIHKHEFTLDDFSHEHLIDYDLYACDESECMVLQGAPHIQCGGLQQLNLTINILNFYRRKYLETKSKPMKDEKARQALMKKYWWQMIQLLPASLNQKATMQLNYQVLQGIYETRKGHRLDEWHTFCDWIKQLPYSNLIIPPAKTDSE